MFFELRTLINRITTKNIVKLQLSLIHFYVYISVLYVYFCKDPVSIIATFDSYYYIYYIHFLSEMYFRKMTLLIATENQYVPDPRL